MKAKSAYWVNGYVKKPIEAPIDSAFVESLLSDIRKKITILRNGKFTEHADTYHLWIAGDGYEVEFSSEDE